MLVKKAHQTGKGAIQAMHTANNAEKTIGLPIWSRLGPFGRERKSTYLWLDPGLPTWRDAFHYVEICLSHCYANCGGFAGLVQASWADAPLTAPRTPLVIETWRQLKALLLVAGAGGRPAVVAEDPQPLAAHACWLLPIEKYIRYATAREAISLQSASWDTYFTYTIKFEFYSAIVSICSPKLPAVTRLAPESPSENASSRSSCLL